MQDRWARGRGRFGQEIWSSPGFSSWARPLCLVYPTFIYYQEAQCQLPEILLMMYVNVLASAFPTLTHSGLGRSVIISSLRVDMVVASRLSCCWYVATNHWPFWYKVCNLCPRERTKGCILYVWVHMNTFYSCSDHCQSCHCFHYRVSSMFGYIRTHFTLALTTVKVAIVSTTVSPLCLDI